MNSTVFVGLDVHKKTVSVAAQSPRASVAARFATGTAEREATLAMLDRRNVRRRIALAADTASPVSHGRTRGRWPLVGQSEQD